MMTSYVSSGISDSTDSVTEFKKFLFCLLGLTENKHTDASWKSGCREI